MDGTGGRLQAGFELIVRTEPLEESQALLSKSAFAGCGGRVLTMQGCIGLLIYMQTPVINMQIKLTKYPIVSKLAKEA